MESVGLIKVQKSRLAQVMISHPCLLKSNRSREEINSMHRVSKFVMGAALAGVYLAAGILNAASLPGTATVSGVVDAPKPFKAAQVYFRNPSKRMAYMVYTVGGRYQ